MALKAHEKKYIKENCWHTSDKQIAETLGRDPSTVKNYRKGKLGVEKGRGGKVKKVEPPDGQPSADYIPIAPKDTKGVDNEDFLRLKLRDSIYFKTLQDSLSKKELLYYEEAWGELGAQFSDVIATEKRQIDEYIKLEIMGNRILQGVKTSEDELDNLIVELESHRKQYNLNESEEAEERDEVLMTMIQRLSSLSQAMSNDYQKTVDQRRKILDDLKARRRDRANDIKQAGNSFLSLLEAFRDKEIQRDQGRYLELLQMAKQKKKDEWRQPKRFQDGQNYHVLLDEHSNVEKYSTPDLLNNPDKEID